MEDDEVLARARALCAAVREKVAPPPSAPPKLFPPVEASRSPAPAAPRSPSIRHPSKRRAACQRDAEQKEREAKLARLRARERLSRRRRQERASRQAVEAREQAERAARAGVFDPVKARARAAEASAHLERERRAACEHAAMERWAAERRRRAATEPEVAFVPRNLRRARKETEDRLARRRREAEDLAERELQDLKERLEAHRRDRDRSPVFASPRRPKPVFAANEDLCCEAPAPRCEPRLVPEAEPHPPRDAIRARPPVWRRPPIHLSTPYHPVPPPLSILPSPVRRRRKRRSTMRPTRALPPLESPPPATAIHAGLAHRATTILDDHDRRTAESLASLDPRLATGYKNHSIAY